MGNISMTTSGVPEVLTLLDRAGAAPEAAAKALMAGAEALLPKLRDAAPVRTGEHIRDRMEIKMKTRAGQPAAMVGVWDEPVAYYVEYGHGGPHPASAHPYMEPAEEAAEDEVMDAIMAVLEQELS